MVPLLNHLPQNTVRALRKNVLDVKMPVELSRCLSRAIKGLRESELQSSHSSASILDGPLFLHYRGTTFQFKLNGLSAAGTFDITVMKKEEASSTAGMSGRKVMGLGYHSHSKDLPSIYLKSGQQVRFFRTEKDPTPPKGLSRLAAKLFPSTSASDKNLKVLLSQHFKTKEMLNDSETSKEDVDKIKIAFAEGYLSGSTLKVGKKSGGLEVLQQLLSIVAICVLLFVIATSSVFKLTSQIAINPETIKVTFDDVKGANDAKEELQEVVEFLRNPSKFARVGGKLPKGCLLVGPPGTGKTLLARALAGEAGVPFFHTCGAEFDEMLVGQGARRVRDLFKTAKENAPCVIFIDEIDAVGSKRTNSILHPHANQTVNQLLAEMDGFNPNEGVIVLGATNRRDDLDPALLRPGRFDLVVTVPHPDYQGRRDILSLYLERVRANRDVDIDTLARGTTGFTGADIESLVNQAAIRAGADGADSVTMAYLESARDKILMGPEIKSRIRDEEANRITAYHEAGHALVAYFTKDAQPLHKVTIVARGASLGHTAYLPEKDKYYITKSELLGRMDTMMGGRAAEDLIFGSEKVTSGAGSDLKSATLIASQMVRDWGMSEKIGLRTFPGSSEDRRTEVGQASQDVIDVEIKSFLDQSYERAKTILRTHAKEHKLLAETLLKYETLDAEQVKRLLTDRSS